jgi:AMP phosphorylase
MKYEFKTRCVDLATGGKYVVILNNVDAKRLDVDNLDRIRLSRDGKKSISAVINLTEHYVKPGELGLFKDATDALKLKKGQKINVEPVQKPASVSMIKKKMNGFPLNSNEMDQIIGDIMNGNLSDVETTAFMTTLCIRDLNRDETLSLTRSILKSGTTLDLKRRPILDKHCTGGVPGNRTSMLIVPIIAAAGLTIPKTSSRSITSPAGTADSMEVLAPVCLSEEDITRIVNKINGCLAWGGAVNLAAADDKLIRIRHPLSLDPKGVLLASILAKKKAVGATHVLIDIPMGKGSKIQTKSEADQLASDFMDLGSKLGIQVECIITPGYDPIGSAIGPALEAREVMRILHGDKVSAELKEKSLIMAGILFEMVGKAQRGAGRALAGKILGSGDALKKMKEIIEMQGGDPKIRANEIAVGDYTVDIEAKDAGRIHFMNNHSICTIARAAGAPSDKGAGIYLYADKGDKIKKGQKLMTIYAESERKLTIAQELAERFYPLEMDKIILEEYGVEQRPHFYEAKDYPKK